MKINNASNNLIGSFPAPDKQVSKDALPKPKLGIGSADSSFEAANSKATGEFSKLPSPKIEYANSSGGAAGARDLTLDQGKLAGSINLENFPNTSGSTDNRSKYESQLKGASAKGSGSEMANAGKKSSEARGSSESTTGTPQDERLNPQSALKDLTNTNASGPDVASKVNQLVSGDLSLDHNKGSEYERKDGPADLKKGASGQLLMDAASQSDKKSNPYGKGMISEEPSQSDTAVDAVSKTALAVAGAAGAVGAVPVAAGATVFAASLEAAHAIDNATGGVISSYNPAENKSDILLDRIQERELKKAEEDLKLRTGKSEEEEVGAMNKIMEEIWDRGQSVEPSEQHPYGMRFIKDPGEDPGLTPEEAGLIGWEKLSPGAKMPGKGGSQGGDVDPTEDAISSRYAIDMSYVERMRIRNSVAQPPDVDSGSSVGSGRGFTNSPQSGGNIDHGPDSTNTGYNGPTRGGDPAEMSLNTGGKPIERVNDNSNNEEKKEKPKKGPRKFIRA
jgi:hypothetical protein